jgi:phenylacetate-CoA ligase
VVRARLDAVDELVRLYVSTDRVSKEEEGGWVPDRAFFQPELETMSRAEIEELQTERLLETLPYVYERSGLVRHVWDRAGVSPKDVRSLDDFRALAPCTSKDEVRAYAAASGDPYGGVVCVDPATLVSIGSTSGTTGDPMFIPERWEQWSPYTLGAARFWWGMGIRPGDYGFGIWNYRTLAYYEGLQLCGAIPISFDPFGMDWDTLIERVRRYQPALLWLGASDVIPFSRLAERYDLREELACVKAVKYAGAPLGPRMKQRMVEEWGLNLYIGAAAGDSGLSFECTAHDGCHLWEDQLLVEHLDPDSTAPAEPGGIGEMVVTAIDNPVAPLIRYRGEDLVRMSYDPCTCGRSHVRQWIVGRKGDEMVVQGRTVVPLDVWAALERIPATEDGIFQVVRPQRELDELKVRVGYREALVGPNQVDALRDEVFAAITEQVGIEPVLELMPESQLLGKAAKVIRVVKA